MAEHLSEFVVPAAAAGQRLDKFLAEHLSRPQPGDAGYSAGVKEEIESADEIDSAEFNEDGEGVDSASIDPVPASGLSVSRSRVQLLIEQGDVQVNGRAEKASFKLRGGESIRITGEPHPAPLRAIPEDIPLNVIYEDSDLAVINKPAGMMVHAGSGQSEDARSHGTLVNALLHRFSKLSCLLYTSRCV